MKNISLIILSLLLPQLAHASLHLSSKGNDANFLYEKDPKALASTISFIVKGGSNFDPRGKEGLMRFSFNSLLRGTQTKSREQFINSIELLGAAIDANTGYTQTSITLNTISENLEQGIAILAETILQPALRSEEIEPLRAELLAKINQERSNNRMLLRRAFRLALYHGTDIAFPPEGTEAGIKSVSISDMKSMLSAQIKSSNIVIAVVSNQDEKKVRAWLEKYFAQLPDGAAPPTPKHKTNKIDGRTLYIVQRKGASTTEMMIGGYGIPANHPLRDELETGMYVFGSTFNSRLSRVLRKENGWTYGAYGYYRNTDIGIGKEGIFSLYSFPQTEFVTKAAPKAVEMYENYVNKEVTKEELSFAQNSMANSYPFTFATAKSRMDARLAKRMDGAPLLPAAAYQKKIRAITAKKIADAVKKNHDPKNFVAVMVGDEEQLQELAKLIPNIKKTIVIHDAMSEKEFE